MTVAVVIPLFNHERYIAETLRSVLAQTRPAEKIMIVDDGSTDRSAEIVGSEFRDARIHLVRQQNAGAHSALNRGIRVAARDCDFIAILNSDDVFDPRRLEKCIGWLEQNAEAEVVCTRLKLINQNGRDLDPTDAKARWVHSLWTARRENLAEWLGIANFAKTSSNFVARSGYLLAHPFQPYRYVHDWFFAVIAAVEEKLGVLDEELLLYRTHPSNTIKSGPAENLKREVLWMNMDLLHELAPKLATSEKARENYTRYFRTLCQNYGDFRAEVFLALVAQMARERGDGLLAKLVAETPRQQFPELNAAKSSALKEEIAQAEYEQILRMLAASRWLALGRIFGVTLNVWREPAGIEKRLALLKKNCESSRWFRLGQRLGFVYLNV